LAVSTLYENCNKSAKDQPAFTLQITQYVANEQNLCPFIQIIYNDDKNLEQLSVLFLFMLTFPN